MRLEHCLYNFLVYNKLMYLADGHLAYLRHTGMSNLGITDEVLK